MIKLTDYQLEQFELHFSWGMRCKLIPFYKWLCYLTKDVQGLTMGTVELSGRWNVKQRKKGNKVNCVSDVTIYHWLRKLEGAKLLRIEVSKIADNRIMPQDSNTYYLIRE